MRLRYHRTVCTAEGMLLINDRCWRVEMYVLANNDATYSLVALAGGDRVLPEKLKIQGPYQNREEAIAARAAIAASLVAKGFAETSSVVSRWRLNAQRTIRGLREAHRANSTACRFDPKDVYFD